MVVPTTEDDFEISMKSYIKGTLEMYGKKVKSCVTPAKSNLLDVNDDEAIRDRAKFHLVVVRLLYLDKRGRPAILLAVKFLSWSHISLELSCFQFQALLLCCLLIFLFDFLVVSP
jgi:hypothetical protein